MLTLAVALSLDSLGVGVAYGLRRIRLPRSLYLIVALCTGSLMGLSMVLGSHLSGYLSPLLARRAGGAILVGVGFWQLYQGWQGYRRQLGRAASGVGAAGAEAAAAPGAGAPLAPRQVLKLDLRALGLVVQILVEPAAADVDQSGEIEVPESVALGLALGLDSLAAGFGAAMAGYGLALVPLVALTCAVFVRMGLGAGSIPRTQRLLERAFFVPGILLMALGSLRLGSP